MINSRSAKTARSKRAEAPISTISSRSGPARGRFLGKRGRRAVGRRGDWRLIDSRSLKPASRSAQRHRFHRISSRSRLGGGAGFLEHAGAVGWWRRESAGGAWGLDSAGDGREIVDGSEPTTASVRRDAATGRAGLAREVGRIIAPADPLAAGAAADAGVRTGPSHAAFVPGGRRDGHVTRLIRRRPSLVDQRPPLGRESAAAARPGSACRRVGRDERRRRPAGDGGRRAEGGVSRRW